MELTDQILTFKFLHVLAVLVFFAGQGLEIPNLAFAARARHPYEVRAHLSMVRFAENVLILPSAIAIPVFGWLTAWRADISLGETWLSIAQTLYFVALAVALIYLRPFYLRMAPRADTLPATAPSRMTSGPISGGRGPSSSGTSWVWRSSVSCT